MRPVARAEPRPVRCTRGLQFQSLQLLHSPTFTPLENSASTARPTRPSPPISCLSNHELSTPTTKCVKTRLRSKQRVCSAPNWRSLRTFNETSVPRWSKRPIQLQSLGTVRKSVSDRSHDNTMTTAQLYCS